MRAAYVENAPRWRASCGKAEDFRREFVTTYVEGDGVLVVFDMDTPATFGCQFHEARA